MKKRVKIPLNSPAELLDLAKKVQLKHTADGDASLLRALKWMEINPALEVALDSHRKAEHMKREMAAAYQKRDNELETIIAALRDSRDILSGTYKKEMKVLGQWGYEVLDERINSKKTTTIEVKTM